MEVAEKKVIEEAAQKLLRDRENAVKNQTYYQDESGCHSSGINAELQGLFDGKWKVVAETKGWDKVSTCPTTHPVQPWTFVELKEGVELRWRFWVPSQFDVYGPEFRAKPSTEAKAAADKIIEDARLEAARIIAVAKAAASKKITITCVKGKTTKKVTAVKPKCPSGYKVKK